MTKTFLFNLYIFIVFAQVVKIRFKIFGFLQQFDFL